jgi:hypothetical protein
MTSLTKYFSITSSTPNDLVDFWNIIRPDSQHSVMVKDIIGLDGPGNFPYVSLVVNPDPDGNRELLDKDWLYKETVLEGRGLALSSSERPNLPLWSCRYNVVLSLALFGTPRPPDILNPAINPRPIPYGAPDMTSGPPRETMLPSYARRIVNKRLGDVLGRQLDLDFQVFEIPSFDNILRLKIDLGDMITSQEMHDAIGKEIEWCFPYTVLVFNRWNQKATQ